MRKLVLVLLVITNISFADNRFYTDDEMTDNIFIEIYRTLNQLKDVNTKALEVMKEIQSSVKFYSYNLDEQAQEAASK